jgi:predicted nucleic acid-binding protein
MVKKLDFNALEKPVLEITLRDKEQTVVRITAPSEQLVERFVSMAGNIQNLKNDNTGEIVKAAFELIAELINCNLDEMTFTAESLRDQYGLKIYDAIIFVKVYLEFIQELENAKN